MPDISLRSLQPEPHKRRFQNNDRIGIAIGTPEARHFRYVEGGPNGHLLERDKSPGSYESFTHDQIADLERTPGWRYDPGHYSQEAVAARLASGVDSLVFLSPKEIDRVLWRLMWVKKVEGLHDVGYPITDTTLEKILADYKEEVKSLFLQEYYRRTGEKPEKRYPFDVRTFWRWWRAYNKGGRKPEALAARYSKCGRTLSVFPTEIEKLIEKNIQDYASEKRPSQNGQYEQLRADINNLNETRESAGLQPFPTPCLKTFARRINDLPAFDVYAGRHGIEAAMKKFGRVSSGLDVTYPGQRVEIDHWEVQLMSILTADVLCLFEERTKENITGYRWHLCTVIDTATRCILGIELSVGPNSEAACAALSMAVRDKQAIASAVGAETPWHMHCGIGVAATDMGSEFVSDRFRFRGTALGSTILNPPAGNPKNRARIERLFGTFSSQFCSLFTGRTFSGPKEKGDYPSEHRACLTVDDLKRAFILYIVDFYHNHRHAGLGGETPYNAWQRLVKSYGTVPPPDADKKRHIFGVELERVVTNRGIRVLDIQYQSDDLQDFLLDKGHGQRLTVLVDPLDLGAITVKFGDKHVTVVGHEAFEGVSIKQWMATQADLRRHHAEDAAIGEQIALRALRKIREIGNVAEALADIGPTTLTAEEIDRAERKMKIAWVSAQVASSGNPESDIFDDAIISSNDLSASRNHKNTSDERDDQTNDRRDQPDDDTNWSLED